MKKTLSIILALLMLVSIIPAGIAAAAEESEKTLAQKYPGVNTTLASQPALSTNRAYTPQHDGEIVYGPDSKGEYWYWDFSTDQSTLGNEIRKSKDLVSWQWVGNAFRSFQDPVTGLYHHNFPKDGVTVNGFNESTGTWTGVSLATGGNNFWAPYVFDNSAVDGYYYMYYCFSAFGKNTSKIGVYKIAKEKGLDGEWEYVRTLVETNGTYGGFNAIDPMVIRDKEGRVWLCYGSFFGGIALVELDKNDPSTLIGETTYTIAHRTLSGNDNCGSEGPTIVYNPEFDYYYLCVSYDDLNGTYNARIGRSKNITGPYVDYNGNNLIYADSTNSATRGYAGTKIVGAYAYDNDNHSGWVGTGHCAFFKAQDGEYYLTHNSRPGNATGRPYINVRRVLWTEDGWPLASSEVTAGEAVEDTYVNDANVMAGTDDGIQWEFIKLTTILQGTAVQKFTSTDYLFTPDGKVGANGSWSLKLNEGGNADAVVNLGNGDIKGKVYYGWDNENWKEATLFIGIDSTGTVYWGKRGATAEEILEKVISSLPSIIPNNQTTKKGITLPNTLEGFAVTWKSNSPEWMDDNGVVLKRPEEGAGAKAVVLTATLGNNLATANFTVNIMEGGDLLAHYTFNDANNLMASTNGLNALTNYGATYSEDGIAGGAAYLDGSNHYMQFPAGLTKQDELTFAAWVKIAADTQWARILDIGGGQGNTVFFTNKDGSSKMHVDCNINNSYTSLTANPIAAGEWAHVAITVDATTIKLYVNGQFASSLNLGNRVFTNLNGNNSFLGKSQYSDPYFNGYYDEVYLYSAALTADEIAKLAVVPGEDDPVEEPTDKERDQQALANIIADNQTISADISLPAAGTYGTPITWTSSDETVITAAGKLLKRPTADEEPYQVTLTAAIDDVTAEFTVFVAPMPYKGVIAHYTFDDAENLTKDATAKNNDLTNYGATAAEGIIGGAAYLDGSSHYMQFPAGLTKQDELTFAGWVKVAADSQWARILDIGGGQGNTLFLSNKNGSGVMVLDCNIGNSYTNFTTDSLTVDEWHHVAVTVDAALIKLYVDGEFVNSMALNNRVFTNLNGNNSFLGKSQYSDPYFNGYYDEVYLYNTALTAEEIAALAVVPSQPEEPEEPEERVYTATTDKDEYLVNEDITITIETEPEIERIQLFNETGKGITKSAVYATTTATGKTWTIVTSLGTKGSRTLYIKGVTGDTAKDLADVSFKVVKNLTAPSDETAKPEIIAGSITAPEKASAGEQFTVTLKTTKAVSKIAVYNVNGAGVSCTKTFADEGAERTWTITMSVSSKGKDRAFSLKVSADGETWIDNGDSFTTTITK